jgi:SNF2 family DNA or RNA helicase
MLRRMKSDKDIAPNLPQPIVKEVYGPLSTEQEELYRSHIQRDLPLLLAEKEPQRRRTIVSSLVNDLRKIGNHPFQFLRSGPKMPRLSGKTQLLLTLLENNYENGEKTLVLTQFLETGEMLAKAIGDSFGKEPLFLHDSLSMLQRDEIVFAFQKNPVFDTLVLVTTPNQPGQSLTAATSVIQFDRWWNPAMEAQLVERACRTSQTKGTVLWRLSVAATFEERLNEILRTSREAKNLTVAAGEAWIGDLPVEELEWLFSV